MPNDYFNQRFIASASVSELDLESSCAQRTYFIATATDDTAKQLRDFKSSAVFPAFKKEYEELLDSLNQWCVDQNIQLKLKPSHDREAIPSFDLFKSRLFGPDNYYDIREVLFFNEGKKSLEKLLLLLTKEHIPLENKKKVLKNLQADIDVCADGTSTNIIDAAKDLGAFLGVYPKIEHIKRSLIQQQALFFIKKTHGETHGNEIHYVNAYYNSVVAHYGLVQEEDHFISSLQINEDSLRSFAVFLEENLTPYLVLEYLTNEINKELLYLREELSKQFFTGLTQRAFTQKLKEQLEKVIAEWNERYNSLISLDMNALILLKESKSSELQCGLATHNEMWVVAQVVRGFRALFLSEKSELTTLKIDENNVLFYAHGLFWIENEDEYIFCTPELFARITTPPESNLNAQYAYFFILKKLFDLFPEDELILRVICKQNMSDLLKYNCLSLLNHAVAKGLISDEMLMADEKSLWWLVFHDQFTSVSRVFNKSLLTKNHIHYIPKEGTGEDESSIWLLIDAKEYDLLERLIAKDLLTSEILLASPCQGVNKGINSIWMLIDKKQYGLLEQIIEKNLLTAEMLLAAPCEDIDAGKNSVWLLIENQKYDLLKKIIARGLLTSEALLAAPREGIYAGTNSVWFLVYARQYDLLQHLIETRLLTSEILLAAPREGIYAGINSIWLLITHQQYDLLGKILVQDLLTVEILRATVREGIYAGTNSIWMIMYTQQYDLLKALITKNLLTQEMLLAAPHEGICIGKNSIWMLLSTLQYDLFQQILAKNLLTPEMLLAAPREGFDAGKNSLFLLAIYRRVDLLQQLFANKLITQEQFYAVYKPVGKLYLEQRTGFLFFSPLLPEEVVKESLLALSPKEQTVRKALSALSSR